VQIPTLDNQISLQRAPNVQRQPLQSTVGQDVGAGLMAVGEVAQQIQKQERQKVERAEFMDADRQTDAFYNDLFAKAQSLQLKDAVGITDKSLEEFDKRSAEIGNGLRSDRQKLAYRESINQKRAQLERQIGSHEGSQAQAWQQKSNSDYMDQQHLNAVTHYDDPKAIDASLANLKSAVNLIPGIDDAQKSTEYGIRSSSAYTGIVQRYLANDNIKGAESYYNSIKDRVNGDKAAWIENAITDAKRIAADRARVTADHRDAVAERALNEIDKQIASGVPATPSMWAGWQGKIRGTSLEGEFKQRLDDEREVQGLLRKPIDQQIKAVQDKTAALDSGGGTVREAANLQRLTNAVQKNITTLQQNPLQFAANRTQTDIAPLNLQTLGDGDRGLYTAQSLQSRVDTIRGMQKQYGAQVQMKPLLPQEVAQLSGAVNSSSPQQLTALFGALRQAAGDDLAYTAIMQQIAPDSPVKAFAGLLAARPRTTDKTTSGDVAATVLAGDAILSPSKTDQQQNGKPKISLYLPNEAQQLLQDRFAAEVGSAFAYRPDAADKAFQAVKAYYVGKADQLGRIAKDGYDVDGKIVKEAVRSVLGSVVDVNGRGEVLAPWGMSEEQFQTAAKQQFDAIRDTIPHKEGQPLAFNKFGLESAGPNSYRVKAGNAYVTGKNGQPVVLTVGQ